MNLEPMWAALEAYQPYAEKHGFGEAWKRMTTERTSEAAYWSAAAAVPKGALAAKAVVAADAAWVAADVVAKTAERAIENITRAIELEHKETA